MRRFEKWRGSTIDPVEVDSIHSVEGTPLGARGEDFCEFMRKVDGFEPDADAYVYTVGLVRRRDNTRWYYVGQTTGGEEGLESRLKKHVRGKMTKTVRRDGIDVLDSPLAEDTTEAYVVIGIERTEPVSVNDGLQRARVLEREREMAYEVAIEKETTRILGGT
jgi:hypothetical protein